MSDRHHYLATIKWTGNTGEGTKNYKAYSRDHEIEIAGKPTILASSDPSFLGDPTRHNPEDMLVASLSACHMLWFLHYCSVSKVVVTDYIDAAEGVMITEGSGAGQFESVTLKPTITITADCDLSIIDSLHEKAHQMCFIARSVNFPVGCEGQVVAKG